MNLPAIIEKEHHTYGGSTVKYWSNCYGWASEIVKLPHEKAGAAADRGTALHKGVLEVKTKQEIEKLLKGTPTVLDYSSIPHWPAEGPMLADEFWQLFFEKTLEGFITGKQIYIERKLMYSVELDAGGTGDIVVLHFNDKGKLVATVGDCKFGRVEIQADDEQLLFYLVALNMAARDKGKQIEVFNSFIYQPECEPKWKEHTFTKSQVERAEERYAKAIGESKKEKPKFKVGDWCEWCKLRGGCNAYTKHLDDQMELTVLRNKDLGTVQFIDVASTSTDKLVKIHLFQDKIKNIFKAVNKELIIRAANGEKLDAHGVKVVEGVTKRKFNDAAPVATVMKAHGVDPYKEPELKGIGEMTTALMIKKELKKKEADLIINPLTIKPEGQPKITTLDKPGIEYVFKDAGALLEGLDDDSEF